MKKIILGSSLGALLLAGGIAVAAPGGPRGGDRDKSVTRTELVQQVDARFARMDVDKDGKLTPADRAAAHKARADARFAGLDADKNGQVSRAEFDAAGEKRMGRRGGPEGGPGEGRGHGKMGPGGKHHGMHGDKGNRHGPGGMMAGIDANKDSTITLEESRTAALARFDKQDANRDGTVTPAERKASHEAMRAAWKADRAAKKAQ